MSDQKLGKKELNKQNHNQQLHEKALVVAKNYKRCEVELIDILEQVDRYKICYQFGYSSLYTYAADYLGLSKDVAAIFINVARKSREVPALKTEIAKGNITVSKARRMTSVINTENQEHWLSLAKTSSKAHLEKEVAKIQPKEAVITKTKYVSAQLEVKEKAIVKSLEKEVRVQLQVGVSEELMLKLRRVQDILSQKQRKSVDLEASLEIIAESYLQKEDPLKKAQRQKMRGKLNDTRSENNKKLLVKDASKHNRRNYTKAKKSVPGHNAIHQINEPKKQVSQRVTLRAKEIHQVYLKYQGKCGYKDPTGKSCHQTRFLEIHHKKPVSKGGTNDPDNLILLCSGHHRVVHSR